MATKMNKEAFEDFLKGSGPIFGELQIHVQKTEDGYAIEALDHEEGQGVNLDGEVVLDHYESTTQIIKIYVNQQYEVVFVEHSFGAFTKANKVMVLRYVNLVGTHFDIDTFSDDFVSPEA